MLFLSARSRVALESMTDRLRDWLTSHPEASLGDVAYTLQLGRRHFLHRRTVVGGSVRDLIASLSDRTPAQVSTGNWPRRRPGLPFMFLGRVPGMSTWVGISRTGARLCVSLTVAANCFPRPSGRT